MLQKQYLIFVCLHVIKLYINVSGVQTTPSSFIEFNIINYNIIYFQNLIYVQNSILFTK